MTSFTDAYRAEAERLCAKMTVTDPARIDAAAKRILKIKPALLVASARTGVPWPWLGAVLERESSCRAGRHLHNGDPLTARTIHVPAGRLPAPAAPPFSFAASAFDALCVLKGLHRVGDWSIGQQAYQAERYNGFGYRKRGLRSPYLWAGCNHQQAGKYVADGDFDPDEIDRQPGVIPLVQRVLALDGAGPLPSPALPAKADLEAGAAHAAAQAKRTGAGAATAGAGAGGVETVRQAGDTASADAVAGVDWMAFGLTAAALALLVLALWLAWRSGWHRRAAAALSTAVAHAERWAAERARLPAPADAEGAWTQIAV